LPKRNPIAIIVGGAILAAWTPFWTFVSGLSTIDFMRTSSGRPSIGTFYLSPTLSSGLNVAGLGVIVYAFILLSRQVSRGNSARSESNSQKPAAVPPAEGPPPTIPISTSQDFGVQTVLPDGRAIISCSLEDLQAAFHKNTLDQFNRLLAGRWVKISGKIHENHGNGQIWLSNNGLYFVLQFAKGWNEQLSVLGRGVAVTVRGKIVQAQISAIYLDNCELL